MKKQIKKQMVFTGILFLSLCGQAIAQELVIYPSNGQSKEQQGTDEGECYIWARDNSGFDPLNAAAPEMAEASTESTQSSGGALRGAARGAIVGGIVDGSDGAKTGAAVGGTVGLGRQGQRNQQASAQQQQQTEAVNQQNAEALASAEANRDNYNRYYATCLEGRGYAVN